MNRHIKPPELCRECQGTGKITLGRDGQVEFACNRCNGTGIEGHPAGLLFIIGASVLLWIIMLLWFFPSLTR